MKQTREDVAQNLAERWCWQAARREDSRVARRLYGKQVVDGVYRLDDGALLDDFFYFLEQLGVVDWLGDVQGTAVQREMVPVVQYLLL
jgi:predicted aminopeptidase